MRISYIKIAWRNLWRNKRRTVITTASILFAVFFATFMRSFQLGFYDHMIKNAIESFSGFLQVQHKDYQDNPTLENSFACSDEFINKIHQVNGVKAVVPRIQTFALASSGNQTKGAVILGIDPDKEKNLSNPEVYLVHYRMSHSVIENLQKAPELPEEIKDKLHLIENNSYANLGSVALDLDINEKDNREYLDFIGKQASVPGTYLSEYDDGVLLSDRLARFLELNVGDTLILLGQGYHGSTAAGIYPVRGYVRIPSPELDNKLIYMTISSAQYFTGLNDRVTTLAINLDDNSKKNMLAYQKKLNKEITQKDLVVKNWLEFNKVLKQQIDGDNQSGKAFLALLYFVVFFGIFGTVLMMFHERKREFGVMMAVGMKRARLAIVFIYEMCLIGLLGVISGIALCLPFLYYFHTNPIKLTGDLAQIMEDYGFEAVMPLQWIDMYVLWQAIVVAIMVILACIYPLRKVYTLKEIEALRA